MNIGISSYQFGSSTLKAPNDRQVQREIQQQRVNQEREQQRVNEERRAEEARQAQIRVEENREAADKRLGGIIDQFA